jgi:energy-coupling factor transporter ATP-binding protein EcfA2
MILSSGTCPSIVALDEVVSYQDRQGVECIFNMIVELARDRQVIVITHDNDLLQMLEGVDKIIIEKKNGFSRIVET